MKREFTVQAICMTLMLCAHAYMKPGALTNAFVIALCAASMWALISAIFKDEKNA